MAKSKSSLYPTDEQVARCRPIAEAWFDGQESIIDDEVGPRTRIVVSESQTAIRILSEEDCIAHEG